MEVEVPDYKFFTDAWVYKNNAAELLLLLFEGTDPSKVIQYILGKFPSMGNGSSIFFPSSLMSMCSFREVRTLPNLTGHSISSEQKRRGYCCERDCIGQNRVVRTLWS